MLFIRLRNSDFVQINPVGLGIEGGIAEKQFVAFLDFLRNCVFIAGAPLVPGRVAAHPGAFVVRDGVQGGAQNDTAPCDPKASKFGLVRLSYP